MSTNTIAMSLVAAGAAALCEHCARQRQAAVTIGGPELSALGVVSGDAFVPLVVVSGCCHDCGAGYCLCRGQLACERCPRKNARVIVQSLTLYQLAVPPAPSTHPKPLGG
jgi:hypothetical protein